ncbi:RNA polymerase sigma factor [Pelagicoccus sp. SDUM812003]|uniref:RNA polymerase sigma factor n=1 Tax=Pelagicoccus sp. SDUM812003 TaxID=3041267 RepID=UPI00280DD7DE|nr:RNA polymerase sigma factor [Pelagicoccus sp. SDUM812003]MDQ8203090.1 RNA polymerase sigma factor [Pelagicoccus sp. SDUM812003]
MNDVASFLTGIEPVASAAQNVSERSTTPNGDVMTRSDFAALVSEHQARLCNFLYRYTRNRQDAEDLVQDTFVKAYRNLHRYDNRYSFSTWLYTIARRTAYNHFRDTKPTESLEYDLVETSQTPDEEASQEDELSWVWEAATSLKPVFREALTLKYVDDLSIEEISRILGKSQTNVKIILFRARNQLKKMRKSAGREEQV